MATEVLRGCSTATEDHADVASPLITLIDYTLRDLEESFQPAVLDALIDGLPSADRDPNDLAAPFQNYMGLPQRPPRVIGTHRP